MPEIIIIGAGPAGISAALTAHARGREVLLVSNDPLESPLAKAGRIDNYPGLNQISGRELVEKFTGQVGEASIELRHGRVISVLPFGDEFMVSIGSDVEQAASVILAIGTASAKAYPGEAELLGRGVSYCATCDGMLYRGKPVCVVGRDDEAQQEANFLSGIGCSVTYVSSREPTLLDGGIAQLKARDLEILGTDKVTGLRADDKTLDADAVFVLRPAIAPTSLITGLEMDGPYIHVDEDMATSIPGVFAAGDCTGKPLQVAKATGQGQIAAFSADAYLSR